jgi:hypothetical protein
MNSSSSTTSTVATAVMRGVLPGTPSALLAVHHLIPTPRPAMAIVRTT